MQLVEHRRKPVGLADLLMHHAVINDGILLQQDGSLVAGWTYRGPDMMSSPAAEMEALSARLNSVLKLGSGLDAPMRRNSRRSAWVLTAFGLTEGQINGSTYTLFHDKMPLENLSETIGRSLLKVSSGDTSGLANAIEVFGPVATVIPYRDKQEAFSIAERGGGSLAASVFSADSEFLAGAALELGPSHGRVLLVDPPVGDSHSGHGIVMPSCTHGGPGRAGGGEELGGLRGLWFYHQKVAVQASASNLQIIIDRTGNLAPEGS